MADQQNSSKSIMFATIAVAILLMVVIVPFTIKGNVAPAAGSSEDADVRIQPVAKFELKIAGAADAAAASGPKDGPTVYASVCSACHDTGAVGAPKKGDKAAWAPRIATGIETLYGSALGGKLAMPARGGAASLSDEEVKGAVDYLVSQAK
ncbi:cytochrome c5 family protein [Azovibrio restrictus]|uniref:c-type cytochrome n=1 Tax=Azovibrio restrictus TaxID=146938 RepID=UPI0026E96BD4|nr:c-type cytochrome [Azovibrio restrictus]MDD3482485.1 c-type cytochrome [Azovibrio restrictus]